MAAGQPGGHVCALSSAPRLLHMHALHAHGRHPMQLSAGALIACLNKEMSSVGSAKAHRAHRCARARRAQ